MANDGRYITLQVAPGINKDVTAYKAEGSWADSDKIRFRYSRTDNGYRVEQIGGWVARSISEDITGVARDITSWTELRSMDHYAVGTHQKLQIEQLGTIYDITPVATSVSTSNAISTVSGAVSVKVSSTAHTAQIDDWVVLVSVSAVSVGGIQLQGNQYQVTTVDTANAYTIRTSTTATSTVNSDGGALVVQHLLDSGNQHNGAAYGWGAGTYDTPGATASSGYGDPRGGDGVGVALTQWSLDYWGEDLLACRRHGGVYHWDADSSVTSRAVLVSTIPLSSNVMFVHPNRHLVLLGTWPVATSALDPLEIRWSDRDNFNDFAVSAGTRAGTFRLQGGGSEIVGYAPSKRETIIFTDDSVWSMRPLNNSLVFGFDQLATNSGLIAQHAAVDVDGVVYWMGVNNFYRYDGRITILNHDAEDFVFDNIDRDQKEKTFCGVNKDFEEVIWLYQSNDSSNDIDRYIKYNWTLNAWDVGTFDRVVWEDSGIFSSPLALDVDGVVYDQESGNTAAGSAIKSHIETSDFDLEDGTDMLLVDQFIPDFVMSGSLNFSITTKKWPNGPEVTKGPYTITNSIDKIDLRARGRQARVKFSTSAAGTDWGIGKPRYRVTTDGER